jgi:hypothetical protein
MEGGCVEGTLCVWVETGLSDCFPKGGDSEGLCLV